MPLPVIASGSVTQSLNRPQRERLPCFEAGISVVKKVKLTVVTESGGRFVSPKTRVLNEPRYFASAIRTITLYWSPCLSIARTFAGMAVSYGTFYV